jgi:multidrug efflux pump subunit AcrB
MWLVNAALSRPYTVWVGMLLVAVLGVLGYRQTPTDILPQIKQPVVVVFASYRGMPAPDMEQSVTSVLERSLTRCDHLDHIESRSLLGIGIIHVLFRPEVSPDVAAAQVIALVNGEMQNMPPGMLPPTILKYDAGSVPVGNLVISSASRDDKYLLDLADHQLRDAMSGIDGLGAAPVFGGVFRQVQIYVHPRTLEALGLSPMDVARIVNTQSQVIPTGEIRIGHQNYYVSSNSMISDPKDFAKIPLYNDGRKIVYLGDVATIEDGTRWRTNTVRAGGRRAVYVPLLRQAGASAVRVVDNVQEFLPVLRQRGVVPDDVELEVVFDQSQYVREALSNLRYEALMGAVLASLVVLLFLGSLRSTYIVALSIPLSVLAAFAGLFFSGATLNIMTLGGLALVLGRVVDDSIVDVENTVRHLGMGKTPFQAALDSAREISVPVLLATITTVIVFLPLTFMTGMGKDLFAPLALSATLAMFASYFVSRTVSPLYCARNLRPHGEVERFPRWLLVAGLLGAVVGAAAWLTFAFVPLHLDALAPRLRQGVLWGYQGAVVLGIVGALVLVMAGLFLVAPAFFRFFEALANVYERLLRFGLRWRVVVVLALVAAIVPAVFLAPRLGQELFPEVDASEFTIHMRASGGPRVEETEDQVKEIERLIRRVVPREDLGLILANIGISSRWSAIYTSNNGPHAAFLRVQLRSGFAGRTTSTRDYVERLRDAVQERFPSNDFFFETGGMIRQILNGGAVAPVEVQIFGRDNEARRRAARQLDRMVSRLSGVTDTYMPQGMDLPQLRVVVDRTLAARAGLTESDVVRNVITSLMSSAQLAPNFWIDPNSGNPYIIGVQYPEYVVEDIRTLEKIPMTAGGKPGSTNPVLRLEDVARIERTQAPIEVYHHSAYRVSQLLVSVGDNDMARVAGEVDRLVADLPAAYAVDVLPDALHPRRDDPVFTAKALAYCREKDPRHKRDRGEELLRSHGVDMRAFADRVRAYVREIDPDRQQELAEGVRRDYGVDLPGVAEQVRAYFQEKKPARKRALAEGLRRDHDVEVADLALPADLRVETHGEIKTMKQSFGDMAFALVLAVLLIYLVMAAQFSSWLDPLVMVVAAPLGLVGVVGTLWLLDTSLNIQSCMGVLMMVGISVSNSVLLVEFANRLLAGGDGAAPLHPAEAMARAARVRLRPILMTTVATVVGLLPMALHLRPGDEMNLPLARAVIGGLSGSTLLTLFVVPVLYTSLKRRGPGAAPRPGTTA